MMRSIVRWSLQFRLLVVTEAPSVIFTTGIPPSLSFTISTIRVSVNRAFRIGFLRYRPSLHYRTSTKRESLRGQSPPLQSGAILEGIAYPVGKVGRD